MGSTSGQNTPMTSGYARITASAFFPHSSLKSSAWMRSAAMSPSRSLFLWIPAAVFSSMEKPSTAENRSARRMRRASSSKRRSGSPTHRRMPAIKSSCPPKGSRIVPSSPSAMALTVKSRRFRSSSRERVKVTVSGRRWSWYAPSQRKVVTSTPPRSVRTVTVPWRRPVGSARCPNSAMVSSGRALVVTSQSSGVRPSSVSRTQPPTHQASWPAAVKISSTSCTLFGIFATFSPPFPLHFTYSCNIIKCF